METFEKLTTYMMCHHLYGEGTTKHSRIAKLTGLSIDEVGRAFDKKTWEHPPGGRIRYPDHLGRIVCGRCQFRLPLRAFHKDTKRVWGVASTCKLCRKHVAGQPLQTLPDPQVATYTARINKIGTKAAKEQINKAQRLLKAYKQALAKHKEV